MTINFPNNPSANDTYTYLSRTWIYTGEGWQIQQAPLTFSAVTNAIGYTPLSNQGGTINGELTISGNTFSNKQFTMNGHANIANALIVKANITSANIAYANVTSMNAAYINVASMNAAYINVASANVAYANIANANIGAVNIRSTTITFANTVSTNIASANILSSNLLFSNIFSSNIGTANIALATIGNANIYGNLYVSDAIRYNIAQLRTESTGYSSLELKGNNGAYIDFGKSDSDYYGRIFYNVASNVMSFSTNSSTKMVIDANGYFSIGTANALSRVSIIGRKAYDPLQTYSDDSSLDITGPGNDYPGLWAKSFGSSAITYEAPEIGFLRTAGDDPEVWINKPSPKSGNTIGTLIWRSSSTITANKWYNAATIYAVLGADENVAGGAITDLYFATNAGANQYTTNRMIIDGQYGAIIAPYQPAIRLDGNNPATINFTNDTTQLLSSTYYSIAFSRGGITRANGGLIYAPVSGYYCVMFQSYSNVGTYGNGRLLLQHNGSTVQVMQLAADGSNGTVTHQAILNMAAGDYVNVLSNGVYDSSSLYMGASHTTFHMFLLG